MVVLCTDLNSNIYSYHFNPYSDPKGQNYQFHVTGEEIEAQRLSEKQLER